MRGTKVILGIASFWEERKGLDVFIRLANELPNDYTMILVGITQDKKKLLPERIIAIDRIDSQEELRQIYGIADVFLNPTLQDNFPTVNLEAVACGIPVITYNTGGSPENAYTPSCVVEKGDYHSIKRVIENNDFVGALYPPKLQSMSKDRMSLSYQRVYDL